MCKSFNTIQYYDKKKGKERGLVYSAQMWITQSYLQRHNICLSFV